MIIQILGLPCSGKSYVIKKIKKQYPNLPINYYDLASDSQLPSSYDSASINIIESAQGLDLLTDHSIKLKVSNKVYKRNCKQRNYFLSPKKKSFIEYYTSLSHFDVFSQKELYKVICILIETAKYNDHLCKRKCNE